MRDYGVVRVRFWDWAKRNKLSVEARDLALYLLTCPHSNSLGCFRLPLAYLCDDLDTTPKSATKTMEELQRVGFAHVDEEGTGWIWIVHYLEHNPIPNGNVGKAVGKMLEQVPRAASFYPDLLASLHGIEYLSQNLIDTLRERYQNGFDRASQPVETHTHTHEPIHDPTPTHDQPDNSTSRKALSAERRGTRLPDDWKLSAEDRAFASDLGLDAELTADEFRDYWTALPGARGRKLDWSKTFRNRCRDLGKKPRGPAADKDREVQEAIKRGLAS